MTYAGRLGELVTTAGAWLKREAPAAADPPGLFWGGWPAWGGNATAAGMAVNDRSALSIPSFTAAVAIISASLASEDWRIVRALPNGGTEPVSSPAAKLLLDMTFGAKERWTSDALIGGTAYLSFDGEALTPLPRQYVTLQWPGPGRPEYAYTYHVPMTGKVLRFRPDEIAVLRYREIAEMPALGLPPMLRLPDARHWPRRPAFSGFGAPQRQPTEGDLATPNKIDRQKSGELKQQWNAAYRGPERAGQTAVLEQGLVYNSIQSADLEKMQMAALVKASDADVARAFNLPVEILGGFESANRATAAESTRLVTTCLRPWVRRVASCLETYLGAHGLITAGQYVDIGLDDLTSGFGSERADTESKLVLAGIKTPNDSRAGLGLPAAPGGEELLRRSTSRAISDVARRQDRQDAAAAAAAANHPAPSSAALAAALRAEAQRRMSRWPS